MLDPHCRRACEVPKRRVALDPQIGVNELVEPVPAKQLVHPRVLRSPPAARMRMFQLTVRGHAGKYRCRGVQLVQLHEPGELL